MSIFRKRRAQNISQWLEIATAKLAPRARDRIWADIGFHYDEAVDGHLQNGLPRSAAHAAALAELGDAKAAASRFRETHLTEPEFKVVAQLIKSGGRSYFVHVAGYVGCVSFGSAISQRLGLEDDSISWVIPFVMLFLLYELVTFSLARRKNPRLLVLMVSVSWLIFGMCSLTLFPPLEWSRWTVWPMLLGSLGWFYMSLFYFRLANKLGTLAQDWMGEAGAGRRESPPENPVAS
jgi:hypothetical protein